MGDRIKLKYPLIVEGRYDKSTLSGYCDGAIITTGGFSIFNNKEKQALIRRIGGEGIIVLTDSDGGGRQIRSFLSGILPSDKIHHVYIPKIQGKESRKSKASRAGTLGVEGMSREVLWRLLSPFSEEARAEDKSVRLITKTDMYFDGLSGREMAQQRRRALCIACDLPDDMTADALLEALNLLYGYDEYKRILGEINFDA